MDRRDLIKSLGLAAGGLVLLPSFSAWLTSCQSDPKGYTPKYLTPEEFAILEVVASRIIPKTDTPGALETGVPAFIDIYVGECFEPDEESEFKMGLHRLEEAAKSINPSGYTALKPEEQDKLLSEAELFAQRRNETGVRNPQFFTMAKDLVIRGYFTSQYGATEYLIWEDVPGKLQGCIPYSQVGRCWANV